MWLERLNVMKKFRGLTTSEIQAESGVPLGTLNKLFAGQTKNPSLDTIKAVVYSLGYTLDDLDMDGSSSFSNSNNPHIEKYKELHEPRKERINVAIDTEHDQQKAESPKRAKPTPTATANLTNLTPKPKKAPMREQEDNIVDIIEYMDIIEFEPPVSAGAGVCIGDITEDILTVEVNKATQKADFIVTVSGDSMEPLYSNGDKILVKHQTYLNYGDIGIIYLEECMYLKKLGKEKLVSLNKEYDDIPIKEQPEFNGVVIGVLDPEWIKKS